MKAHMFGCLILLVLIKSFSCDPVNPFKLDKNKLTATEGSCIEIKCNVSETPDLANAYWFWMKDAIWTEAHKYSATIIYSSFEGERPVSPHFAKRVDYVGSKSLQSSCSVLIRDLTLSDSGNYSFRFIGRKKWATKPFMNLTVTKNPCLLTFAGPKKVTENSTVTLTCSTLSSCPSDLKIKDALGLLSSRSSKSVTSKETTFSFNATWEDDGRVFSCQTEKNDDPCLIRNIRISVGYDPKNISAKTSSTNVREGQPVTLTCSAKGQPNPSFTWTKQDRVESTEATWTIPSVNESHSGSYHCTAQNTHGSKKSEEVIINVKYVPDVEMWILLEPQRIPGEITQGDRVNFTCAVTRSNPPPHSFTWWKNNRKLDWKQTHVVESIEPEHSGNYTCEAQNAVGSGSKTLALRVRYKPKKTRILISNTKVKIGTLLNLTCETDAYPPMLSYSWYRETRSSPKMFMGSQKTLEFKNVQRSDDARYMCNASNVVGTGDTSEPTHIEVLFPPNNTKLHMTSEVTEGQAVTVDCTTEGFPPSSFTLARSQASNSQTSENSLSSRAVPFKFKATAADAGIYTCEATNSEGSQRSPEKELVVKYTPKEVKVEAHPGLVVKENESLTLNCKAKSYPLVTAVTWTKMTNGMSESTRSNVTTFTVKPVGVSDSGWYSCAAQNQIGTGTSERVEVQVKYGPKHTLIIKGKEVRNEDGTYSVTLSCISQCFPPVSKYSWYRRTGEEDERLSNLQNFTVNSQQAGEHYCVAINEIGERASEPVQLFDNTITTIFKFFLFCLLLLILCVIIFLYRRKRSRLTQRGASLGRRSGGNRGVAAEPSRSRDDLLPDQPCRLSARQHERHPDATTASSINTVYSTVNLPKGKQAASAQNPIEGHSGHMENDSLNYASLHFVKKKKAPAEDAEYAVVSKPNKSKKKEEERLEDYENINTADAPKPPFTFDFDTDTSEDDVEVSYTQVNFKPKSGHQKPRKGSSSGDETQYSDVKI